jgi:hypothetical protein
VNEKLGFLKLLKAAKATNTEYLTLKKKSLTVGHSKCKGVLFFSHTTNSYYTNFICRKQVLVEYKVLEQEIHKRLGETFKFITPMQRMQTTSLDSDIINKMATHLFVPNYMDLFVFCSVRIIQY